MRKIFASVSASAIAVVTLGTGALMNAAGADSGDGKLGCNTYEICFSRDLANTTHQKHFYNSANHDNYQFTNVTNGNSGTGLLEDNAAQVRNRDGSCDVKVIDWNGALPSVTQTVANNGAWTALKNGVINQNNEHQRVNCG